MTDTLISADVLGSDNDKHKAALESDYAPAVPRALEFLGEVGRMKYLKPLYKALLAQPGARSAVEQAYQTHRDGYHPIARHVVESLFADADARRPG